MFQPSWLGSELQHHHVLLDIRAIPGVKEFMEYSKRTPLPPHLQATHDPWVGQITDAYTLDQLVDIAGAFFFVCQIMSK